jgi:hypothetical protein
VVLDDVIVLHFLQVLDLPIGHILLEGMHLHLLDGQLASSLIPLAGSPHASESALAEHLLEIIEIAYALHLLYYILSLAHMNRQIIKLDKPNKLNQPPLRSTIRLTIYWSIDLIILIT